MQFLTFTKCCQTALPSNSSNTGELLPGTKGQQRTLSPWWLLKEALFWPTICLWTLLALCWKKKMVILMPIHSLYSNSDKYSYRKWIKLCPLEQHEISLEKIISLKQDTIKLKQVIRKFKSVHSFRSMITSCYYDINFLYVMSKD